MAVLKVAAPAKINLHLEVLGLRSDGFHELAMVMQTIDLCDTLAFQTTADGAIRLTTNRADLPTDGSNLIVQAGEMLRARSGFPELGAQIHLLKQIPIGAGLAGGSSNGAAALVGLNALWGLGFSPADLAAMAAQLGSDMPFCLDGGTQLCFGRGELLEPVSPQANQELAVLLIKQPSSHVSTPWAYGRCKAMRADFYLDGEAEFEQRRQALRQGALLPALASGEALPPLRNDLQQVVEPEVESVRLGLAMLRQLDGPLQPLAVAMSGSGPSSFALFASLEAAQAAQQQLNNQLAATGFDAWSCRLVAKGASLL